MAGAAGTKTAAGTRLVIVESPKKARMIAGFLGSGYVVESSFGHIRDLPSGADEIPAKYKGLPWARLGVNVEDHFDPLYVVPADKKAQIRKLKDLLKGADELFLATDEDREGEAIAWHLLEELKPTVPVKRMVFHEITPKAIQDAVGNARDIDEDLVDAQEARRILDRLYGYEVSPVLWKKVMPKLSAGRVQSVAIRMVVDRERERIAFRSASYWDLDATLDAGESRTPRQFPSRLVSVDSKRVAQGRDFSSTGELKGANTVHLNEQTATALAAALRDSQFTVRSIESKPYTRKPYAPFRTTTLQQEAGRKLGMSASQTMQVAQRLYENGNITYMRTDSVTLSDTAITAARAQVRELYGASYLPDKPRVYTSKVKNAQEAHEAIRPAGEVFQTPAQTGLSGAEFRLYELIWMRTIASQMKDAAGNSVSIKIDATASSGEKCEFTSSGRVITFHGFLKAYVEGQDDPSAGSDDQETRLPNVEEGDVLPAIDVLASGHETKPPARYTEATLVGGLEEREIGRPSTYASIIGTIQARKYIYKKGQALVPAWLAFAVVRLLEEHFTRLVDYAFTATMEDVLDEVAAGDLQREGVLSRFYFGDDNLEGLKSMVTDLGDIDAREMSTFPVGGDDSGIVVRVGRYGPYVEDKDERRANVPEDLPPDELTVDKAKELLEQPSGVEHELGTAPDTGLRVVAKAGRFGPYVTEVLPEDAPKSAKPRTGSLLKSMTLESIGLDDAMKLLSLPRVVGKDPESGDEITAQNGRYGPYLKKGTDSRSLSSEEQMFDITLEEALAIYAEPKQRGRRAAAPPLKELGEDPESKKPVVVKEGRFGPYVTDGETNATLRKDDSVETISLLRAAELLAEKRARGPVKKTAKKAAKKTAAKKTAAKKTAAAKKTTAAKKTAAKKTAAKKTAAKKTAAKKS
ncbi:type I DNA topoisomerase [Kribbella sp. VKM Ac-2566]|uniref:type I DNA topoisomerase n=1 Tax=Kribbella sp. VKM Ac-2566 TaxID=2512218 RepID=UPI0010E983C9|nr:type I DNA topoisomerase [Kribbella sp. VKM Ac-2566]TDW97989.1 DNA topoisomerase I [Kribbella sp. VKM Ac-2566]